MRKAPTCSLGQLGEEVAAGFLESRGFEILERNVRSRLGEIDLIARDLGTLVFIEVKARRGRFEVVAVTFAPDDGSATPGGVRVEHFPGAFAADGWTG